MAILKRAYVKIRHREATFGIGDDVASSILTAAFEEIAAAWRDELLQEPPEESS
jgi:hypothetical protein